MVCKKCGKLNKDKDMFCRQCNSYLLGRMPEGKTETTGVPVAKLLNASAVGSYNKEKIIDIKNRVNEIIKKVQIMTNNAKDSNNEEIVSQLIDCKLSLSEITVTINEIISDEDENDRLRDIENDLVLSKNGYLFKRSDRDKYGKDIPLYCATCWGKNRKLMPYTVQMDDSVTSDEMKCSYCHFTMKSYIY